MKIESNDESILFSVTAIPDIFFTEYLPQAPGEYVKVILYIIFISKYGKDIKFNDMSKKLALHINVLQDALKYWEEVGVLTKKNNGFILNNLREKELHNLYKPKVALSAEDIEKNTQNQYRAKAVETINTSFFQGMMTPSWYSDIDLWFKKYLFDEQVMIALFNYCYKKSALHRNYVQTVADAWSKNNIKTFSDLEIYSEKQAKLQKIKNSISKKLGLARPLTEYETAYIEKWTIDYNYPLDVIEIALKKTTSKANPSFDYLNSIISSWHEHNLKDSDEVKNYLLEFKNQQKNIKELEKKTKYNNYEQRTYTNFDNLYANLQNDNNS
jgi:DnaD/phage-associated family protein